ncbi:MAG TPA: Ig-like domain-containing protein [Vicinamibacterales bacterium]|nr:Ig-like domain-containing protein [Vicinamibacterales bacterium]
MTNDKNRKRQRFRLTATLGLACLLAAASGAPRVGASGPTQSPNDVVCFPTCSTADARFLVIAGDDNTTLGGESVLVNLSTSPLAATVRFGLFDGDRNGIWDRPNPNFTVDTAAPGLLLELFADPSRTGAPSGSPLHSWSTLDPIQCYGNAVAASWPDNQWCDIEVPSAASAKGSDRYSYVLRLSAIAPLTNRGWNAFKVRTGGSQTMSLAPQAFAFLAPYNNAWASIVYPSGNPTNANWKVPTTYDGSWSFALTLESGASYLTVWDGDMDYGDRTCTLVDTDDPDTPAYPSDVPAIEGGFESNSQPEGRAIGLTGVCASGVSTGNPNEDAINVNLFRPPTRLAPAPAGNVIMGAGILYDVTDPTGVSYVNLNPSGNTEWERFQIKVAPGASLAQPCLSDSHPDRALMDCKAVQLPAGIYTVGLDGADMNNLNFWRFLNNTLGFTPSRTPVEEGAFFSLGRYVWYDSNENGLPDPGELPIANVKIVVTDSHGVVQEGYTTSAGEFFFRKPAGTYSVQVDPSNFDSGGPLSGRRATTGSNFRPGLTLSSTTPYLEEIFGYVAGETVPPTARPDHISILCGSLTFSVTANDSSGLPDGSPVTLVQVASPFVGTAVLNADGTVTYVPKPGYTGTDSFRYTIANDSGAIATGTVSVTIGNQAPEAVDDVAAAGFETSVVIPVLANDSDGDGTPLSVQFVTLPPNGTAVVNPDGTVTYTPNAGFSGTDSFSYGISDGCATDTASVTVTVAAAPPPPPPPPTTCSVCDGKVKSLTLQYLGSVTNARIQVLQQDGGNKSIVVFDGIIQPGGTFSFTGVDKQGTLGPNITVTVNGAANTVIHTSCSQPIGPGLISGDFKVVEGESRNGGRLCPMPGSPTPPSSEPPTPTPAVPFRSQTQGGWGSKPSGNNPGALLAANFGAVYGVVGVQIGGAKTLRFTSASSVSDFLPQGGTAAALKASAVNPTKSDAGVFAGQVLALQLSVDFSRAGVTAAGLANLKVKTGKLAGYTVGQVLALANAALGGDALPTGITINDLNSTVDAINNNFVDGTMNAGYLQ